jgi:hypothetical protein
MPQSFVDSGSFGGSTIQVWTAVSQEAPPSLMRMYDDHAFITSHA